MSSLPGLRFQDDLDAAVLLVAEHLVHLGPVIEADRVGDDEGRIDRLLAPPGMLPRSCP
jgi:hypothetical protein